MGVCGISKEFLVVIRQITIIFFMQIYSQKCNVFERIETLKWLHEQVGEGFYPRWFITYHLHHPQELVKPIKETNNPFGYKNRYGFDRNLWNYLPRYNFMERERSNLDAVIRDTGKIRNLILRKGYGIKRLNQTWKYKVPHMIFAHELGKYKLQYHTHLLLPEINKSLNSVSSIKHLFEFFIRTKIKCMSRWKSIEVIDLKEFCKLNQIDEEDNTKNILSYLNKETKKNLNAIDYENSIFYQIPKNENRTNYHNHSKNQKRFEERIKKIKR